MKLCGYFKLKKNIIVFLFIDTYVLIPNHYYLWHCRLYYYFFVWVVACVLETFVVCVMGISTDLHHYFGCFVCALWNENLIANNFFTFVVAWVIGSFVSYLNCRRLNQCFLCYVLLHSLCCIHYTSSNID